MLLFEPSLLVNALFFDSVWLHEKPGEEQREYAERIISLLKLKELRKKSILEMSEGEGRKMLVARALVSRPRVLMLDEPCSGLDMAAREDLLTALEKLSGTGTGIVMVTHHPEDLIPSITHLLVMEDGRILDKGRKEKILRGKSLSAFFGDLSQPPFPSGSTGPYS